MEVQTAEIVDSISCDAAYKSVTDRYFSRRYCTDVKSIPGNDHLLLFHSNKICVITLAPSHPVFSQTSVTVDYQVGNLDRTKNAVKGKGKKGGQHLEADSLLCKVVCGDGREYVVRSCIRGKLVEVNEALVTHPELLLSCPDSSGYIAVVLANIPTSTQRKEELLTPEEYTTALLNK